MRNVMFEMEGKDREEACICYYNWDQLVEILRGNRERVGI